MNELVQRLLNGDRRALARALTHIERSEQLAREIVVNLFEHTGRAHIVGITGAPGTGKSSLVNQIARELRLHDILVGIVAVDPSSPFTGGALLGDRVRMQDLSGDDGVFIRSMASRGNLGGLARATASAAKALDAAGFGIVLIETVGAGQAEVSIATTAHTTIVVEAPGMGDEIQSIKAGILEIADILIVNKADRPGASRTTKALRLMLHMGQQRRGQAPASTAAMDRRSTNGQEDEESLDWDVKVMETVAVNGKGIPEVVAEILAHGEYLRKSKQWKAREMDRSRYEIEQLLQAGLLAKLESSVSREEMDRLVHAVATRKLDPYSAASQLFRQLVPSF